jgi:hypothetical protein
MNPETIKNPWQVEVGDVILRHPDRPHITGEWRVTGTPKMANGLTTVTYDMPDGEGVFVIRPEQTVSVRPATTYRLHALFTREERETAIQLMAEDARNNDRHDQLLRFAALVEAGWPEIFDAAYLRVETRANLNAAKETTS